MQDEFYMKIALELAKASQGQTSPNPVVGAVIVKNGEIMGIGSHLKAGEQHAEIHALTMAGDRASGGTIYLTLEPCSHYGKTPPCTDAVITAGIVKAVIASTDNNPLVAGKGIENLQDAGIEVVTGICEEEARRLNESFFYYMRHRIPFITLKNAITLDGKTATKTGHSKWITGEQSRKDVHSDRGRHDAILVGIRTVMQDDPSLTNRDGDNGRQPIRVVLDTHLNMPLDKKLVNAGESPTWIFTGSEVNEEKITCFKDKPVQIYKLSQPEIDINELLVVLGQKGITSLYVEGGKTIHTSFLKTGRVNRLVTYVAPKILGGLALSMFSDLQILTMKDTYQLKFEQVEQIGKDIKITSILK